MITLTEYVELRDALADALEGLQSMAPYVPDYFMEKWALDEYMTAAQAALAEATEVLTR